MDTAETVPCNQSLRTIRYHINIVCGGNTLSQLLWHRIASDTFRIRHSIYHYIRTRLKLIILCLYESLNRVMFVWYCEQLSLYVLVICGLEVNIQFTMFVIHFPVNFYVPNYSIYSMSFLI